jgi:hypothetical protein
VKFNTYSASHLENGQGESIPLNQCISINTNGYKYKSPLVRAYTPCNDTCSCSDRIGISSLYEFESLEPRLRFKVSSW